MKSISPSNDTFSDFTRNSGLKKNSEQKVIYHMLPSSQWQREKQTENDTYVTETLVTEGYIHCTGEADLLVRVANNFYRTEPDSFVILCIDSENLESQLTWDQVGFQCFPHLYGPLNLNAVIDVVEFPRQADGLFTMPVELLKYE